MRRVTVEVRPEHIEAGTAQAKPLLEACVGNGGGAQSCCPVHHALRPHLPKGEPFLVDTTFVEFVARRDAENSMAALVVYLPEEARSRIAKFDQTFAMEPFSFEMDLPEGEGDRS